MAITVSGLTVRTQVGTGTWKDYGGGGGSASNTDVFLSSTSSRARKVSNGIKGFALDLGAGGVDLSNTVIVQRWATLAGVGALDTRANSGVVIRLEDTSGNISDWAVDGTDTYLGGWKVSVIDTKNTETTNSGTAANTTVIRYVGMVWDETASVGGGDPNCYIDEILTFPNTGLSITGNSTSVLTDLQTWDDGSDYGLFETRSGILFSKANFDLRPDATDMSDSDVTLVLENPEYYDGTNLSACLSQIGITCTDSDNVTLTRCTIIADTNSAINGTDSNREFDISTATDFDLDTCTLRGFDGSLAISLGNSGQAITFCNFDGNGKITAGSAIISDCIFRNATDASGAFLWDENTDIEKCTFFSDGTGYGIHYRPTGAGPFTESLNAIEGVNYGLDETVDSFIHINPVTTSVDITFNITGAPEPTYDEDAGYTGTFTSIVNPVTTLITVRDRSTGLAIQNARVELGVTDSNNFPFQDSVTITSSGTTATVTHTAHGLSTNDYVKIEGANENRYNGAFQITVTGVNTYTYTMIATATSPATGTITSSFNYFNTLTDINGQVSDTRSISIDQAVSGKVRKSSSSPYYQETPIDETIDSDNGLTLNIQLISDE